MVKNGIKWTLTAILIILVIFSISFLYGTAKDSSDEPLKIAWMTTWAEGAVTAEVLEHKRLLEKHDIDGEVVPFLYGPPMVEAALTGEVNALFVGWVPAVSLLSKSDDWIILSRLAYFPMELMARNGSGIQDVKDLEGKKIAVPYATGPYPLVIDSLKENGLDSKKDVTIVNIKPSDLGVALQSGDVDAVSWAEPLLTLFRQQGIAYPIEEYEDISFVVISKEYVETHPEESERLIKALMEAQYYFANNKQEVFKWFSEDSKFDIELVESLKLIEDNFYATDINDVELKIPNKWIEETQRKIDFEYEEGIIDKRVILKEKIYPNSL